MFWSRSEHKCGVAEVLLIKNTIELSVQGVLHDSSLQQGPGHCNNGALWYCDLAARSPARLELTGKKSTSRGAGRPSFKSNLTLNPARRVAGPERLWTQTESDGPGVRYVQPAQIRTGGFPGKVFSNIRFHIYLRTRLATVTA